MARRKVLFDGRGRGATVIEIDHGAEKISVNLQNLKNGPTKAKVGFSGDNAAKAVFNEMGVASKNIPARPFMRTAFDEAKPRLLRERDKQAAAVVLKGKSQSAALKALGVILADEIKDQIEGWTTPPNAPSTVAKKGFNDPLVETGDMSDDVTIEID